MVIYECVGGNDYLHSTVRWTPSYPNRFGSDNSTQRAYMDTNLLIGPSISGEDVEQFVKEDMEAFLQRKRVVGDYVYTPLAELEAGRANIFGVVVTASFPKIKDAVNDEIFELRVMDESLSEDNSMLVRIFKNPFKGKNESVVII